LNPQDQFTAQKTAALQVNNNNFKTANDRLQQGLAERGFSGGGKFAAGLKSNAVAQAGSAGAIEGQFQGFEAQQREQTLQDALKFSFANPGSTSVSNGSGSQTQPGGALGGAVAGGAQTATFLYALNHLMGGNPSGPTWDPSGNGPAGAPPDGGDGGYG